MDFYNNALASNTLPHEWAKDDDGVWGRTRATPTAVTGNSQNSRTSPSSYRSLFETQAAFDRLDIRNDTNPTSVSSIVTQHDYDADRDKDFPKTPESDFSSSGRATPHQQPLDRSHNLVGIGDALLNDRPPRRRPTRLEETNDEYGKSFVTYKEKNAAEKIQAAGIGEASQPAPYQLAVYSDDDLCPSNGPERITEERVAVCSLININNHAGENCRICHRPPDYYDISETHAATEEESTMPAPDVEWLHRMRDEDAAIEQMITVIE